MAVQNFGINAMSKFLWTIKNHNRATDLYLGQEALHK